MGPHPTIFDLRWTLCWTPNNSYTITHTMHYFRQRSRGFSSNMQIYRFRRAKNVNGCIVSI